MKVIEQYIELEDKINRKEILSKIERAGRTCYKSENNIKEGSAERFIQNIIKSGHESVIEHASISVRIICDRGVTHEIVRHRIASYSQESTRYCNYCNDKFGNELTFIEPCFFSSDSEEDIKNKKIWLDTMDMIEKNYNMLIENGAKPEEARAILPNSLKTEIVVTMNLRAWRNFLRLRMDRTAHPQIRDIALKIFNQFNKELPEIFSDLSF